MFIGTVEGEQEVSIKTTDERTRDRIINRRNVTFKLDAGDLFSG